MKKVEAEVNTESFQNYDFPVEYIDDKDCEFPLTTEEVTSDCNSTHIQKPENHTDCKLADKYFCKECMLSYTNKNIYQRHLKTHDPTKQFKCEQCQQMFSKQFHLNVHLRKHIRKENKKFICSTCGEQFIYKYLLKQHIYKHTNKQPFPCDKCQKGKTNAFKHFKVIMS